MIALALRLGRSDTVRYKHKERTLGFGSFDCSKCLWKDKVVRGCHRAGLTLQTKSAHRIDYNGNQNTINFCPNSLDLEGLAKDVLHAIAIEKAGGLDRYFGRPVYLLPHSTVYFYQLCLAAHNRYQAQRDKIYSELVELTNAKD